MKQSLAVKMLLVVSGVVSVTSGIVGSSTVTSGQALVVCLCVSTAKDWISALVPLPEFNRGGSRFPHDPKQSGVDYR